MRRSLLFLALPLVLAVACGRDVAPLRNLTTSAPPPDGGTASPPTAPPPSSPAILAATPPMGWNDWAHYQCSVNEQLVLANAQALISSGLAAKGYNTVTVDDCWMAGSRDNNGDLQANPHTFPHGMAWLGAQLHALGLKFGIYEDAGAQTCGGYPGSGQPQGGGADHFLQDTKLFASWGVDYLKLDGCNLYVPSNQSAEQAYRAAYAAEASAIATVGWPIVFSESAPAYFRGSIDWTTVLGWVGQYGQLWRLGTDIRIYDASNPTASRWYSVVNNYEYTKDEGQFTKPGNWNDPDFIIAGDPGLTTDEAHSQVSLWSMMAAPLILSSDLTAVTRSSASVDLLGNTEVLAIDQDPLGQAASVNAGGNVDVLIKPLQNSDRAVAFFNHSDNTQSYRADPNSLGFGTCSNCSFRLRDVWAGTNVTQLSGTLPAHATALFRVSQLQPGA